MFGINQSPRGPHGGAAQRVEHLADIAWPGVFEQWRGLAWWIVRASSLLPVPDSPSIRTGNERSATRRARAMTRCMTGLWWMIAPCRSKRVGHHLSGTLRAQNLLELAVTSVRAVSSAARPSPRRCPALCAAPIRAGTSSTTRSRSCTSPSAARPRTGSGSGAKTSPPTAGWRAASAKSSAHSASSTRRPRPIFAPTPLPPAWESWYAPET